MNISTQLEQNTLHVLIEGSIDTITAPELETKLKEQWDDVAVLCLDFAKVNYVSSAGLRVVLEAEKHMRKHGKMRLRNVCQDVKEVFEMTGFNEILTFE